MVDYTMYDTVLNKMYIILQNGRPSQLLTAELILEISASCTLCFRGEFGPCFDERNCEWGYTTMIGVAGLVSKVDHRNWSIGLRSGDDGG